jgi:phospholipid/cholesterol/gamma-HCH transport system substrate-binding protein
MSQSLRLGAFILVALTILGVAVFLVGSQESKFELHYRVQAQFQNVAGLTEGADVRVGGIRKGTVRRIMLPKDPDGKVTVMMDLAKESMDVVKQDSTAAIKSEGLLGDKFVEVSFGTKGADSLKGGETLNSQPPIDISDLINRADQILDTAQHAMFNIQGASGNVSNITAKINQGKGTVGALVNDRAMYEQATAGVTALREDAEALKHNFLLRGFFHKRGFEDSADLTKDEIAKLPSGPIEKTFAYDSKELFDKPDSAKFSRPKSLSDAGSYLQTGNFSQAVIAASTGMKGDSDKDRQLTEARAYVIRKYLVDNFRLDDKRIKTIGLGKSEESNDAGKIRIIVFSP